jgi:hypothetical protein
MTLTQNFFIDILNIVKGDNFYCEFRKKTEKIFESGGRIISVTESGQLLQYTFVEKRNLVLILELA